MGSAAASTIARKTFLTRTQETEPTAQELFDLTRRAAHTTIQSDIPEALADLDRLIEVRVG